jgi:hypothetical protein
MLARSVRVLTATVCFVPGCVDAGEATVKPYCRALCDLQESCEKSLGIERTPAVLRQCQRDCLADPDVLSTREEALVIGTECFAARECTEDARELEGEPQWQTEQANAVCLAEASDELEPSKVCKNFCDDLVDLEGCSTTVVATCRQEYCAYVDEVVEQRRECFRLDDCTERRLCLEGAPE